MLLYICTHLFLDIEECLISEVCFNKARGKTGFRAMEWLVSYCMLFSLQIHIQYRHHCGNDPLFGQGFFYENQNK